MTHVETFVSNHDRGTGLSLTLFCAENHCEHPTRWFTRRHAPVTSVGVHTLLRLEPRDQLALDRAAHFDSS
ncbi:MAG: hypothetical protein ACE5FJ_10890, partial [Gemmatimonadales bacterium]